MSRVQIAPFLFMHLLNVSGTKFIFTDFQTILTLNGVRDVAIAD